MSNETLKYIPSIAIRNYVIVFVLCVLVIFASKSQGISLELILLKLAMVPLIFLAPRGLQSIYRQPIIEHKVTARAVEFTILSALITTLAVFIVLWTPELSASELVKEFAYYFAVFAALMFVFMARDIRRKRNDAENA